MKHHRAQIVADKRKWQRWRTQFKVIQKDRLSPQRKSARQVSRTGLIDPETSVRRASTGEEALRQWRKVRGGKWFLNADSCGAREDPAPFMELVVAGILHHNPREICLRAKYSGSNTQIEGVQRSLERLDWIIACIADVAEIRQ